MPRIIRWFPVSHDINADAEVWAMRRQIGEKSLSIWLEILSIADRNDSELPGDYQELVRAIAGRCQATVRTVIAVFDYAMSRLWVESQPTLRVAKYAKYHKTREQNKIPRGNSKSSLPSLTTLDYPLKDKDKSTNPEFEAFWKAYPRKVGKGAARASWRKIVPANGTSEKIIEAVNKQKTWKAWKDGFIPLPATWLNQTRWEDEGQESVGPQSPFRS